VKERLVAGVQQGGTAIIGVDDDWCSRAADRIEQSGKRVERVSVEHPLADGLTINGSTIVRNAGGTQSDVVDISGIGSLRGLHNAQNAASASAAVLALGVAPDVLQSGLRSFPGLAHRMEQVGRLGTTLFVNDSKATNADATAKALSSFHDIFWIAGGKAKEGGITPLAEYFPRIRKAYLIGEAANDFSRTLDDKVPYEISVSLDVAVANVARDAAEAGLAEPVVLLSPACASFDQFRNFEIRGDRFRELVRALDGVTAI
jgi:UDP-N-acetylmuramoylalanine--D-glutamate ligase